MALGVVVAGLLGLLWHEHSKIKSAPKVQDALTGNLKGFTNMMKLTPLYYNYTSTNSAGDYVEDSSMDSLLDDNWMGVGTPWVLPAVQDNGMMVGYGITNWGDAYSNRVSEFQLQERVSASHL